MDKYYVIDATAPRDKGHITGHAARWLEYELERHGALLTKSNPSVVLMTCVSTDIAESVPRELKRLGVEADRFKRCQSPIVVLGGHAALTPAVFDDWIDVACVGEGGRFVATLLADGIDAAMELPEAWIPGASTSVVPSTKYPWHMPPSDVGDNGVRIIAERGCSRACLFCGVGWSVPHVKSPHDIGALIDDVAGQGLVPHVSANDLGVVPPEWTAGRYSSVTFRSLKSWIDQGIMPRTEILRIGVEAPSERLRAAIRKPIPNAQLWDVTYVAIAAGHKVKWQLISGLPGETDDDIAELRDLLRLAKRLPRSVLMVSWTSYVPHPATPLGVLPLEDSYHERYEQLLRDFHMGPMWTRRLWLGRGRGPASRIKNAMKQTAASEAQLRKGFMTDDHPNWRVQYPRLRSLRKIASRYQAKVLQ